MLIPTPYTPAHPNAGLRSPPSQRDRHVVLLHLHVQICHANESRGQPEVSGKLLSQIYEQTSTLQHAQPGRTHLRRLYGVYLQIVNMCAQTRPFLAVIGCGCHFIGQGHHFQFRSKLGNKLALLPHRSVLFFFFFFCLQWAEGE